MRSVFLALFAVCALAASCFSEPCTDSVYATANEDTVNVSHNGSFYNCCAVIAFETEIGDTTIDIVEKETYPQGPCHCLCCFDLRVSVGGVPPGVYWVSVWNEDKTILYGKVKVIVGAIPSGPFGVLSYWQSDCHTAVPGGDRETEAMSFGLGEPVPNPASGSAQILYTLDRSGRVSLGLYDSSGRLASAIFEGHQPAGRHSVLWNGTAARGERLPSGVYFVRLSSESGIAVSKLVLAR